MDSKNEQRIIKEIVCIKTKISFFSLSSLKCEKKYCCIYIYIYIFLFFAFNSRLVQEIYLTGTGSIVSFHCSAPRHCQLTLCVFFRCSRVFAIRPETRKLRQTLLRVNSIEAFDQKLSFSLKGLRPGSTGSINGTSTIYLFLRPRRRRSRCEITTFNYSRSFVFPPRFLDASRPRPRIQIDWIFKNSSRKEIYIFVRIYFTGKIS